MNDLPQTYSMWDATGKLLGGQCRTLDSVGMGRSLTTFSTSTLHPQADGTCIERGVDGRGSWLYRQWPSLQAARGYTPTFPKHVQMEQW